ncbi:hypothetical protein BXZ70DRAFT_407434 [Cristinia sonorae]|uniref:Uncharacterized protein n=1 Tax=Cristinia sonorae TaxID=1940300 RepID=A0A8K0UX10_9AGAR|nr:hypothetical protein BXZ70DRAFT_407434 [Cristinia sonorae]
MSRHPSRFVLSSTHPSRTSLNFIQRAFALSVSFAGAIFNGVLAIRLLTLWRSLRWETESEWESSAIAWRVDPVKLIWGLLSVYFAAAATAYTVGFVGIARNRPLLVRFFRDYSIADFVFITMSTMTVTYAAFTTAYLRTGICEELSRQSELLRDVVDTGMSIENCEFWFEKGIVALLGMMLVLIAMRLHFVVTLSRCYSQVRRERYGKFHSRSSSARSDSLQRIYLLPNPVSPSTSSGVSHSRAKSLEEVVVYAPVPLGGLSEEEARGLNATEAWILHPHSHSHSHYHHHRQHSLRQQRPQECHDDDEKYHLLIDTSV